MKGLVKKYKQDEKNVDKKLRDQLIIDYAPLIKFVAYRIAARLPSNIELDDLISAGVIGLMDALDKYDPSRDNKFKTYAEFRIRGAILDELRSQDWVPRSIRDKAKRLDKLYNTLEQRLGRPVSDFEISEALGVEIDVYYNLVKKVKSTTLLSVEELSLSSQTEKRGLVNNLSQDSLKNPFNTLNNKGVRDLLMLNIDHLPEKQRLVLSLYYYEDLNLKEIGKILEVTESRVSQLHTKAVETLRAKLKELLLD